MNYNTDFYKDYLKKLEDFSKLPWVVNYIHLKKKPNFWTILEYGESVNKGQKKSSYEIRMSRMIRWLLDANENHGLGNLFAYELFTFMDQAIDYPFKQEKNRHIKAINEALKDIDIFYKDLDQHICMAIEFKQYSKEIIYEDGTSQLDKYEKAVQEFIHTNEGKVTPYYIFLTPNKDKPTNENWFVLGYADVIKILDKIMNEQLPITETAYQADIQKIILDFRDDLQRTIDFIQKNENTLAIRESYSEEERELTKIIANEITHQVDSAYLDELLNKDHSHIEEMEEVIILLNECMKAQTQDHTPNDAVKLLIRKIYLALAEESVVSSDIDRVYTAKERLSDIKHNMVEENKLKVSKLLLTQGKGQGIYLLNDEESRAIYFSGDKDGSFPNDRMQLLKYNEKNEKGRKPLVAKSDKMISNHFKVEYDSSQEDTLIITDQKENKVIPFDDFMENYLLAGMKELNRILD